MEEAVKSKADLLHDLVLDGLITRLQSKDANSTDYANAIKFLKDNPKSTPEEEARKKKLQDSISGLDLPFVPASMRGDDTNDDF